MAQTPDINAILAALAAQNRSGGPPSQAPAPPVGLPPGYPPAVPQSSTPTLGGFALPQPTSSGSLDLSSVRPVSTGSVSIAEAIAKARSIAADKNVGASRDDPRLAGRGYGDRERSRSPQRRDAHRDNYNPYRDERRSDDRRSGGGYGRDRSRSPPRNQGYPGAGGAGAVGGGGAGGGDKDTETITVKSALVGLIIGRGGENLRRVESETGARVQFIPAAQPGAAQRQCTISGTRRQVDAAKREIFHTIEENGGTVPPGANTAAGGRTSQPPAPRGGGSMSGPPVPREGEQARQILVPDKTVGLIIGRGGETIRDLQDRSGCHVNIVGENKSINGRRPVNLIGTREAADKAEAIIWEIVDSDERTQGERNNRPAAAPEQYGGGAPQGFGDDKITESIQVPSEAVGMIIGKGGESIKEMQQRTGCKINVNQPGNPDIQRQIDLVGSRQAIEAAKRAVFEKVDTVQQRDRENGRGGGGGGGGGRGRDDGYGQQQQASSYAQPAQQYGMPGMAAAGAPPAGGDPSAAAADPYAAYGGYQNYMALWYQAMAAQGGQQPPPQ